MVSFRWFGQACFEIGNGKTIVTDPHDGDSVGLDVPQTEGDIVTVSHDHYDHASGKGIVSGSDTQVIEGEGDHEAKGTEFTGIGSYHDKVQGDARGENTIFCFQVDGIRICHLGDLGHMLTDEQKEKIGSVDILMVPVGGNFTVDGSEAADVVEELDPQVVIPMHFEVDGLEVPISGPEEFLRSLEDYNLEETDSFEMESLPDVKKVVRLECLT